MLFNKRNNWLTSALLIVLFVINPITDRFFYLSELILLYLSLLIVICSQSLKHSVLDVIFLGLYVIILALNALSGDEVFTLDRLLLEVAFITLPFILFNVLIRKGEISFRFLRWYCGIIAILSAMSIPQLLTNPLLLRQLLNIDLAGAVTVLEKCVGDYGKAHVAVFFVPIYFAARYLRFDLKFKVLLPLTIVLLLLSAFVLLSSATTALLFMIILFIVCIAVHPKYSMSANLLRLSLAVLCVVLLTSKNVLIAGLTVVEPYFEGSTNSKKISLAITYLETGALEGGLEKRDTYHDESLTGWKEKPLFGQNSSKFFGRHSFILDRLSQLGIVGFLPLILLCYVHVRRVLRRLMKLRLHYLIGLASFLALITIKNPFSFDFFLVGFCMFPLALIKIEEHYKTSHE